MTPATPRFPLFDSLRAIAALSIFVFHLPLAAPLSPDTPQAVPVGHERGVAVFFLVSGFLLYRPFAQARFEGRKGPATLLYAERRAAAHRARLLGGARAWCCSREGPVRAPPRTPFHTRRDHHLLRIFAGVRPGHAAGGISAAWTLCVEVTFYAMLPFWAMLHAPHPRRGRAGLPALRARGPGGARDHRSAWTSVAAINDKESAGRAYLASR